MPRTIRSHPAKLSEAVLLQAAQRLAGVIGTPATLLVLQEAYFEHGDKLLPRLCYFAYGEGPWASWREVRIVLNKQFHSWPEPLQLRAILFTLCVTHTWLSAGITWSSAKPPEHTTRTCEALGIPTNAELLSYTPDDSDPGETETIHQGPDQ